MSRHDPERQFAATGKVISAGQYGAWSDARELLAASQAHVEASKADGYREGYEAGQSEGRQAVLRSLIDTQTRASHYLEHMDREVAAIVIAMVERIIGQTPAEESTLMAARQALSRLRKHKNVRLQVPPTELERFRKELADLPSPTGEPGWLSVEADNHLQPHECVIATEAGYIRAGVDAQLENLRQTVFDSLQSRHGEG